MEGTMAFQAGKPIVTDERYDQLKRELRLKNSMVVQQVHTICMPSPSCQVCQQELQYSNHSS